MTARSTEPTRSTRVVNAPSLGRLPTPAVLLHVAIPAGVDFLHTTLPLVVIPSRLAHRRHACQAISLRVQIRLAPLHCTTRRGISYAF